MKKPSWFSLADSAALSLFALLFSAISVLLTWDGNGYVYGTTLSLTLLTIIAFMRYVRRLLKRKRLIDSCAWIQKYGIMVCFNGCTSCSVQDIIDVTKTTLKAWARCYPEAEEVFAEKVNWLWFYKENSSTNMAFTLGDNQVSGITIDGSRVIPVACNDNESLRHTSYAKSLGYMLHGNLSGTWDPVSHYTFTRKHGLQ